jgi:hypothetical protein
VSINGTRVLSNFDIYAAAGGALRAVTRTFPVTVTNGTIAITFRSVNDLPAVNGIEVTR